jgi:hypothetical protein
MSQAAAATASISARSSASRKPARIVPLSRMVAKHSAAGSWRDRSWILAGAVATGLLLLGVPATVGALVFGSPISLPVARRRNVRAPVLAVKHAWSTGNAQCQALTVPATRLRRDGGI